MRSLLLAAIAVGLACARPLPDRPRHRQRFVRMATDWRGQRCFAELPLTIAYEGMWPADMFTADLPWTAALGFPVTAVAGSGAPPDVVVALGVRPANHPTWLASTASACEDGWLRHRIEFYGFYESDLAQLVATHELGHALGVVQDGDKNGHSPDTASVMYYAVGTDTPQWVTPADAAALRRAWRRQ